MNKTIGCGVDVRFGDCAPASTVFFPGFSRWMDAEAHHYFAACGVPAWHARIYLRLETACSST